MAGRIMILFISSIIVLIASAIAFHKSTKVLKRSGKIFDEAKEMHKRTRRMHLMSLELINAHKRGDKETLDQCKRWFAETFKEL